MTEPTIVALTAAFLAAIPPTLASIAALIQSRRVAVTAAALVVKTDEIHGLANSNLQSVKAELAEVKTSNLTAVKDSEAALKAEVADLKAQLAAGRS